MQLWMLGNSSLPDDWTEAAGGEGKGGGSASELEAGF